MNAKERDRLGRLRRRVDYLERVADNHHALAELSALEWIINEYQRLRKLEEACRKNPKDSPDPKSLESSHSPA